MKVTYAPLHLLTSSPPHPLTCVDIPPVSCDNDVHCQLIPRFVQLRIFLGEENDMGVIRRFFRYLKALIMGKLDQWEDPEIIINESLREMKENQIKNRERAVQAITQKNNLQNLVDQEEKLTRNLEAKATMAVQQGNRELARQLLREKGMHDSTLA